MINFLPKPKTFTLQWHITERCNSHCKHCYQSDDYIKDELNTNQLFKVLDQYIFLIKKWNLPRSHTRINITGGEPFIRSDFFKLAKKLGEYSHLFRWGLLSNGSFLTKENVKKLKKFKIVKYQLSLEGNKKNNDNIRGKGTFKKVINSIKLLTDENIDIGISLTLTKENVKDIPQLVEILDKLNVNRLSTRRLIPYGRGSNLKDILLEPNELRNHYLSVIEINKNLKRRNGKLRIGLGCESAFFNDEVPPFMRKNYCGLVDGRIIIVMPNGDVLPCRRLPLVVGNVLNKSLFEIYYNSNKLWESKNLNNISLFCQKCTNFSQCFGGAKCVAYSNSKKLVDSDNQCWKIYKQSNNNEIVGRIKKELKLINYIENVRE